MRCPKCEGAGWFTPKYTRARMTCEHCDGTGEIREGDVWKCQSVVDGFYAYLFYNNPGWKYNGFTSSVVGERLVEPICRMKEVE